MHFELYRIRSEELIREADAYRLAHQCGKAGSAPRSRPAGTWRPVPWRLPAWLRR
ncbi:hypothetical protein [Streptomyces sp. NPDC056255]|uniref:hypothetical protein n=1 Tax=Streptomyces sp. NPDC056255 TaxID=3345764 RepID=UPI0035D723D2